jgi:hypothetical protein
MQHETVRAVAFGAEFYAGGRWLGLIGGPVLLVGNMGVLCDWWERTSAVSVLVAPEFLWELLLGIYAAVWGFRRTAPILSGRER